VLLMAGYMASTRRRGHSYDADLLGAALGTIAVVFIATWAA